MTHPLFAALDAAVTEHGWPDDVRSLLIWPELGAGHERAVALSDKWRGHGITLADAYTTAVARRDAAPKPIGFTPEYVKVPA